MAYQSPFAPAQIDFSQLGKLAETYYGAQADRMKRDAFQDQRVQQQAERERQEQMRRAVSQGIPTGPDGQLDYAAMVNRVMPFDPTLGTEYLKLGSQERERAADRAHRDRTFTADQAYRRDHLALEREKLNTNRKDTATRESYLNQVGIDPNSAEGQTFLLTGKLPAAAYNNIAQEQRKRASAPKIAEGLQNLNNMTETYNDTSFINSLGPFQGSTPDSLIGSAAINIARGYGELSNWYEGGNATPNEVRNNVTGATEALAAAIKPLIRAPGEGVWTDADQARLVAIVGDLPQASSKPEFKRRLNAVRDRVRDNFGLDIPFDAMVSGGIVNGGSLGAGGGRATISGDPLAEARDAIARGAPRDKVLKRLRQNGIVPKGL